MDDRIKSRFLPYCDNESQDREVNAENCKDVAVELAIKFLEYVEKLKPASRVSVWSKNGEYKGLFNMDAEQLFDKFVRDELK